MGKRFLIKEGSFCVTETGYFPKELNAELEEKIRKFVLKETMKEIQELYYDVEEPH